MTQIPSWQAKFPADLRQLHLGDDRVLADAIDDRLKDVHYVDELAVMYRSLRAINRETHETTRAYALRLGGPQDRLRAGEAIRQLVLRTIRPQPFVAVDYELYAREELGIEFVYAPPSIVKNPDVRDSAVVFCKRPRGQSNYQIWVNPSALVRLTKTGSRRRRRLAVAHELSHVLLGHFLRPRHERYGVRLDETRVRDWSIAAEEEAAVVTRGMLVGSNELYDAFTARFGKKLVVKSHGDGKSSMSYRKRVRGGTLPSLTDLFDVPAFVVLQRCEDLNLIEKPDLRGRGV